VNSKSAEQEILEKTDGKGVNVIFNTVESTPYRLQSFLHYVSETGRVVEFEKQKQAIERIGRCLSILVRVSRPRKMKQTRCYRQALLDT